MVLNILGLVVLIVAVALLAWSSVRALRNENRLLKWGGAGSAGLLAAMAFVVIVLMSAGLLKLTARTTATPNLKVAGTPDQIQRGRAIADSFCAACHSRTGPLTGGVDIGKHLPIPVGSLVSSNLLGAGLLPGEKPVTNGVIKAPPKSPGAEYGEYILSYQDCRVCHGANLMGGMQGQLGPIGPGLTLVKDWKLEEFISTMRTGTDPAGHELGKEMPWQPIGKMDDEELTAIYQYLIHLPGS
jgi:mono/diheme cytochrome c family protein